MAADWDEQQVHGARFMTGPRKLSLLIAGVDGTLGTHEKILTDRARKAVHRLQDKGVRFAITSGRPPVGVSDDLDSVKRCESDAQAALGHHATAARKVKRQASAVTDSYDDEGFAKAVERFLLGASAPEEVSS
jgi:hydroxymethylpyrimidine pyrophosphatase-like HAD family hydrolase